MNHYEKLGLIKVTTPLERFAHTVLVITWAIMVITGFAMFSQRFVGLSSLFGGLRAAKNLHNATAWWFLASVALTFLVMFKESFKITGDDFKWLAGGGGYLWDTDVPDMGRFNLGQKGFYFFTILCSIILGVTGWYMVKSPALVDRELLQICYPVHSLFAAFFVAAWAIHAYFGSFCNPGSIASMTYGWVSKSWAKKHHGAWLDDYPDGLD